MSTIAKAAPPGTYLVRGVVCRASSALVTINGVDFDVEYRLEGDYLPATDTDPAELPAVILLAVYAGNVDILRAISETSVEDRIISKVEGML